MDQEIRVLLRHLRYSETPPLSPHTAPIFRCEWWVTPHRLEGLPFHEFMMGSNASRGTVFGADSPQKAETRFDLANLSIQRYGDAAVASYTLLLSTALPDGVQVVAHNESRVIVRQSGAWKVVHVHKSPAWSAPHTQPG
jgi:hypothetical protein